MDPITLLIAGGAALAIILIALGISMSGTGGVTELIAKSAALAQLNKVVEKRDFGANLLVSLGAADLKLKPSEYIAIWGGTTLGVPLVMFFLGFVVPSLQNPIVLII